MISNALFLAVAVLAGGGQSGTQTDRCQQRLTTATVCQQCYVEVNHPPFAGQVYLYAPAIQTGFIGTGFRPFTLWIVEGVYGRPFARREGSLDEAAFERVRQSRNVLATPIGVDTQFKLRTSAFKVRRDRFVLEITNVQPSLRGTSRVTVNICR